VNLHVSEALTSSAAAAIAGILERAAAEIRSVSANALADLPHCSAHGEPPDMDALLDPPALAALLKIDERTLRRRRNDGTVPAPIMLGTRKPRWRKHVIDAWLDERSDS
jgi:predicted DNA-binding transcriptional regulator AlpA